MYNISNLLGSIISNFLLEYVFLLYFQALSLAQQTLRDQREKMSAQAEAEDFDGCEAVFAALQQALQEGSNSYSAQESTTGE